MQKFVYNLGCVGIAMICGMPVTAFASDGHSQPKNLALQTTNQDHTVTGVVLDESGQPVIGATIVSKTNPKIMSTTDVNGQFSINVKNSDDVPHPPSLHHEEAPCRVSGLPRYRH